MHNNSEIASHRIASRWITLLLAAVVALLPLRSTHAGAGWGDTTNPTPDPSVSAPSAVTGQLKVRTYYANSPQGMQVDALTGGPRDTGTALRKFVDPLPGLSGPGGGGITLAVPDTTTYPGSDYYEIAVVEYTQRMHSDLAKATTLRGYVQIDPVSTDSNAGLANGATAPAGSLAVPLLNLDGTPVLISRPHNNDGTFVQVPAYGFDSPHYLGATIVATHGRPTRVKFYNGLPAGHGAMDVNGVWRRNGDLFIPVDHTLFGGGDGQTQLAMGKDILCGDVLVGPNNAGDPTLSSCLGGPNADGSPATPLGYVHVPAFAQYTENREELHLHGGDNPWISDGHPHQWITPAADELAPVDANYQRGGIAYNVPDMPNPGPGAVTYYWPNGQSGRLMFFHDHATGLTRLNVYVGTAAGYLLTDPTERALNKYAPGGEIPLVIQDKTFVPRDILTQDAKWDLSKWGQEGDLWFPHVYETNQDPLSADATNPVGRWDGASFFWPVFPQNYATPDGSSANPSTTPEAFMDTPIVNGMAYPVLHVPAAPVRFRILGVGNDRMLNLSFFQADGTQVAADGRTNTEVKMVPFTSPNSPTSTTYSCPDGTTADKSVGAVNAMGTVSRLGWTESGISSSGIVYYNTSFPCAGGLTDSGWGQADNRPGGVPDPATMGPDIVRIGNEGGLFQGPVVIPPTVMNYEYNKRSVTVLNVLERSLWLGPAERADVMVDFSAYAGKTLILYNDSGAPVPAGDPRIDYYTGDGDQTGAGGAPNTAVGYGPNTRTIMQVVVDAPGTPATLDAAGLGADLKAAYQATQPLPVVPTPEYAPILGAGANAPYEHIYTGSIYLNHYNALSMPSAPEAFKYTPAPTCSTTANCAAALAAIRKGPGGGLVTAVPGQPVNAYVESKAIQELFEADYGRMNATLGVELPFTNVSIQTTIPLAYVDPATETITNGETQFWKITHNGVDSHPVHFHFINVQVINRVGWDGTIKAIPADEVGWKETVKMHPLEDIIVAVRAKTAPPTPFGMPHSYRQPAPSQLPSDNHGITQIDPATGNAPATPYTNAAVDYFSEYVWHCHILGHEENDFMRPFLLKAGEVLAPAFAMVSASNTPNGINVTWNDPTPIPVPVTAYDSLTAPTGFLGNPDNEIGFRVERAAVDAAGVVGPYVPVALNLRTINPITHAINTLANASSYTDPVQTGTALTAPVAPALASQTVSSVTLTLPVLNDALATGYNVYRNGVQVAANVPAGAWVDTNGVAAGQTYLYTLIEVAGSAPTFSYRVAAVTAAGDTYSSNAMTANGASPSNSAASPALTVLMAPTVPTGLVFSNVTAGSMSASWTAGAAATSYDVALSGGAGSTTPNVAVTTDALTALTGNTLYTVSVTARNSAGTSATALTGSQLTLPNVPGIPLVTGVNNASVSLSWAAPPGGAAGYQVQYSADAGATWANGPAGPATAAVAGGLLPNTAYLFRVVGTNAAGAGLPSGTASALTMPLAPAGLNVVTGSITTTSVTLAWSASAGNGALTYTVQYSANGGGSFTSLAPLAGTGTTVSGLTASTAYLFQVVATNASGSSLASGQVSATTLAPIVAPGVPGCCTASNLMANSLTLNWTAPAVGPATSYTVQRATNATFTRGLQTTLNITATSLGFTGLNQGGTYYFRVLAVNSVGSSAYSPAFIQVMPTLPAAPNAPAAALSPIGTTLQTVTLTLPAPAAGVSYTIYQQSRAAGGGVPWGAAVAVATGVTGTSYTSAGLLPATQYRYYLVAVNTVGSSTNGNNSNAVTAQELANAASAPSATAVPGATVGAGTRQMTLTWSLGAANDATVTAVRVLRNATGTQAAPGTGQTNGALSGGVTTSANLGAGAVTTTIGGLARNTQYFFQVQVTTAGGNNYSTVAAGTTAP